MKAFIVLLCLLPATLCQVDPADINFYMFSRDHIDSSIEMFIGDLNGADYDPRLMTKFIVHSSDQSSREEWIANMKLSFLATYECQVIVVNWEKPAGGLFNGAAERSKEVGDIVGTFISYLESLGGQQNLTHCVGFGIGAHVCGFAGKVQQHEKLGRISGLDPNNDGFNYDDPANRLTLTDADFVDVIHTCGGAKSFAKTLGHVDFFPNDGANCDQPGCGLIIDGSCSHARAHEYFTESIGTDQFVSTQCTDWADFNHDRCNLNPKVPMGDQCPPETIGEYYLHTRNNSPYAMG